MERRPRAPRPCELYLIPAIPPRARFDSRNAGAAPALIRFILHSSPVNPERLQPVEAPYRSCLIHLSQCGA
jgi:hypothetical protein